MSNPSILEALAQDRKPPLPKTKPLPPKTQRVCIDLPGEEFSCYVTEPNVEVMLRKHRDVVFDINQGKSASYTVFADQSDFYNARDKKLVEHKKKHKVTFKDGERLHIWISRDFKGRLLLKQDNALLGEYHPNRLDRTDYGSDPITKPEPLVIAIGKAPTSGASVGMCTSHDPFGIAGDHGEQRSLYEKWLKDMPAHGTQFDYNRLLDARENKTIDTHEYVVVAEVLASEIQPQVRAQLDRGVAVQDLPEKIFAPLTAETALAAASAKLLDALLESAWKESAGYVQEHWRQYRKLGMTVRIEKQKVGKYAAIFKTNVATQKIPSAAAKQIAGAAASRPKPKYSHAKLGSPGSAFLDGGFEKTGRAGYGGAKRIFLKSAKNFKSGMKIQIVGTVFDLFGDMMKVFGENGSNDLSEFLGRAGVTLIKAGVTAVLGSLFAAGIFMGSAAVAGAIGVAAIPVAIVVSLVVIGYILSATLVELIDTAIEGKERVANWTK